MVIPTTLIALLAGGLGAVNMPAANAEDHILSRPCLQVESYFARGSGQSVGLSEESNTFTEQLEKRLGPGITFGSYEVGQQMVGGNQYPAVKVSGGWEGKQNAIGAFTSKGDAYDYGASVDEGVDELAKILKTRSLLCKDKTTFVLGGYSQGAQVVGDTFIQELSDNERKMIAFNAHFGDPKLYLPEGESKVQGIKMIGLSPHLDVYASACRGEDPNPAWSSWRRNVPDCNTDNGSLGARKPYVPKTFTQNTGLWCADDDFVCGSDKWPGKTDGHSTYDKDYGDIWEGAQEAADRIAKARPELASKIDIAKHYPIASGTTGLDVVFLIDSTGSMSSTIDEAKEFVSTMSGRIQAQKGRVALVEYRDAGDEFTARILSGLNPKTADLKGKLETIEVNGGGDDPEAVLHALMTAFNGLEWRNGATKAAIVLTDETYHDPDVVDGSTLEAVAKRSLEIDPVNVYPVVPEHYQDFYDDLARETTGQVVVNDGNAADALDEALTRIETRPVPLLPHQHYYAPVGETISYDASKSYSVGSEIVKWDWDFDGDGTYEILDGSSKESHLYDKKFDGVMQARATDANGLVANISAFVHVGTITGREGIPAPAQTLTVTADDINADLEWTAGEEPGTGWGITVGGIPVGMTEPDARTAKVTDLDRTRDLEVGVVPMSKDGLIGKAFTAIIPAETEEPIASETPTPSTTVEASDSPTPTTSAEATESETPSSTESSSPSSTDTSSPDATAVESDPAVQTTEASIEPAGNIDKSPQAGAPKPKTGDLSDTGFSSLIIVAGGILLLGAGAILTVVTRRRLRKH